jgi:cyclophilin family peptidyl-prolyl cis-trans isomerase
MAGCAAPAVVAREPADEAAVVRRARLIRIEDTRRDEPAFLDSMLRADDARERATAAITAGRIRARTHLARLRTLAADPDTGVAASALFALGLLRDSGAVALGASALRSHPVVAGEGAWLLGELGAAARAEIVSALGDARLAPVTRGALLLAAARLRPVPADAVIPLVASDDTLLASRAAYVLARGRSSGGVRSLLEASDASSAAVREQAARGLSRAVAGDSLGERARLALRRLVDDVDPRVRVNAVRSLASHGRVEREPVLRALRDRDAGVRLVAAQSLDLVLDSSATAWAEAFAAETTFVVQRAVAEGAARRGIVVDGVRPWRTSAEWQRRAAALELDARGVATEALSRVLAWSADPDARVRAAAAGALATLADSAAVRSRVRPMLRSALLEQDVGVRAAALGALARGATEEDLSAAIASYRLAGGDADNDARLAFWQLVDSALARTPVLPDSTSRRLDALSRPAEPLERLAAARMARFARWRDSTSVARPFEWYVARAREALSASPPIARIETERGTLELTLHAADAPLTVHNFVSLAQRGYFDGQRFHRVVPNFVVQGGDPRGDGNGGPGYAIRDELNRWRYLRGTLGMALSGPDTGGSQFFIAHSPQPHLDGGYTVFGQLLAGGDVLDRIVQGDRIVRITIR